MKASLIALSILGLLAWTVVTAYRVMPSLLPPQLPAELTVSGVGAVLEFGLPVLAFVVGIMGTVNAGRHHAARWEVVFATLAVLAFVLPVVGLYVAFSVLFSYDPTQEAGGQTAVDVGFLFPVLVFLVTLIYAVRSPVQPAKGQRES